MRYNAPGQTGRHPNDVTIFMPVFPASAGMMRSLKMTLLQHAQRRALCAWHTHTVEEKTLHRSIHDFNIRQQITITHDCN
jgi:hypothetical protein